MAKKEIIELLPWYINNTLDDEETRLVTETLEKDDEIKKEYEYLKSLSDTLRSEEIQTPGEIGLARLKRSMKKSTQSKPKAEVTDNMSTRWKVAAIAASLLLVVQVSFMLNQTSEKSYYNPLGSEEKAQDLIVVTFSPTATEQQIREALLASDAIIVEGPSAAGIYIIHSTSDIKNTLQTLRTYSEVITHVQSE